MVRDAKGNTYASLSAALRENNLLNYQCGGVHDRFRKNGKVVVGGMEFTGESSGKVSGKTDKPDPLMEKLRSRYTDSELESIAKGEGIERTRVPYPEIRLFGKHHRIAVISDTHIGSIYAPPEWHGIVADYVNTQDIDCVLHCGDLVDGLKIDRAGTQIYELSEIGYDAQKAKAVELLSLYRKPMYIISGNHDAYFRNFSGADIVQAVADALPNVTCIGSNSATIDIDGCKVQMFHGLDGNSYALSYRMQKLIESYTGGRKPAILLAGHTHKFCHIFERNVHAVSVPCLQMQTAYMEGKKLAAHTGFLVLDFDTIDGNVCNFSVTLFPFYA